MESNQSLNSALPESSDTQIENEEETEEFEDLEELESEDVSRDDSTESLKIQKATDFQVKDLHGNIVSLQKYSGQVLLICNIASK